MKNAETITIYGKIPFAILTKDTLDSKNNICGKGFSITTNDSELMAEFYTRKIVVKQENSVHIGIEDFWGELSYTRFLIVLTKEHTIKKSLEKTYNFHKNGKYDYDRIIDITFELVNKFVKIYKYSFKNGKDWIPPLTTPRLCPFRIRVLDSKANRITSANYIDYRGTGVGLGNDISKKKEEFIQHFCMCKNLKFSLTAELSGQANRFKSNGEYKTAVVYLATFIEQFIFREVRKKLKEDGVNPDKINAQIKKKNGKYIHRYKALELVLGNQDFKNLSFTKDYEKYVITPRNEIIHNDSYEIDKTFAEKMMDVSNLFISEILKLIWGEEKARDYN